VSVERIVRKDGSVVWRVRWRQDGRNRAKVLGRKGDAELFDAELVRHKRIGTLAKLDAGKEPLSEFGEEWWRLYGEPNLARSTLKGYAILWDAPGASHATSPICAGRRLRGPLRGCRRTASARTCGPEDRTPSPSVA
jgi:hypothetical protein